MFRYLGPYQDWIRSQQCNDGFTTDCFYSQLHGVCTSLRIPRYWFKIRTHLTRIRLRNLDYLNSCLEGHFQGFIPSPFMNKFFFCILRKEIFLKFRIFRHVYSSVCCVNSLNTFWNNSSNLNEHFLYATFISKSYDWNRWCIFRPTHIRSTLLLTSSHVVLQQRPTTYPVLAAGLSPDIDLTWPQIIQHKHLSLVGQKFSRGNITFRRWNLEI